MATKVEKEIKTLVEEIIKGDVLGKIDFSSVRFIEDNAIMPSDTYDAFAKTSRLGCLYALWAIEQKEREEKKI